MRVAKHVLFAILTPVSVVVAQLSGGIGPVGEVSSWESTWRTSAALWGTARLENPHASSDVAGEMTSSGGAFRFGNLSGSQRFFSPSLAGFRAVTSLEANHRIGLGLPSPVELSASTSVSYRRGMSGTWLGVRADKDAPAALRVGGWRHLGNAVTFSFSSALRRGTYGRTGSRTWTGTYRDSLPSDSGWVYVEKPGVFGDSGSPGQKLSWFETEARLGWSRGRFSLDGAVGWRPPIDSAPRATWFRAITTIAVSKGVALSAGAGTAMQQIPYARSTGRYATIAVRLAPAALVRPREAPEITSAATSFNVERLGDQYVVRVRLPRARTVELSGDFNSWQALQLAQEIDGSWSASLALKPGVYRMNLRVDGERWLPPPGTPTVDDEFNGKVGLIVVR